MKHILFLAALAMLSGCASPLDQELSDDKRKFDLATYKRSVNNCLDNGGTIIRSTWDNQPVDCVYPVNFDFIRPATGQVELK